MMDAARPLRVLSLGAGVQSSTLALMCAAGEIAPMPDCAIFADTQAEPASVYEWLGWLEARLPFKVHRVTAGALDEASLRLRTTRDGKRTYYKRYVPSFTSADNGKPGMLPRKCTEDFKIVPIQRKIRALLGITRAPSGKVLAECMIGISLDEVHRMKPSRLPWIRNVHPLIDARLSRHDCLLWMERNGFPKPPRSACVFCPYHSDAEWARLKSEAPDEFARAVAYEKALSATPSNGDTRSGEFLHELRQPLDTINFNPDKTRAMFGNECEGMCGV